MKFMLCFWQTYTKENRLQSRFIHAKSKNSLRIKENASLGTDGIFYEWKIREKIIIGLVVASKSLYIHTKKMFSQRSVSANSCNSNLKMHFLIVLLLLFHYSLLLSAGCDNEVSWSKNDLTWNFMLLHVCFILSKSIVEICWLSNEYVLSKFTAI